MTKHALILAAGKGTRMNSPLPKTLFPILKKPMIEYILDAVKDAGIESPIMVVGYQKEMIMKELASRAKYVFQDEQLGTAHAVMQAEDLLKSEEGSTLIMLGDMPLIDDVTIKNILASHETSWADLTLVTTFYDDPKGYGRILRDKTNNLIGIVEELSASEAEKAIKEVNTGLYVVDNQILFDTLKQVKKNPLKGEYYLTDIIGLLVGKASMNTYTIENNHLVMGVNDLIAIAEAEKYFRKEINQMHMRNGVSMINPDTITIGHEVKIEPGVALYPNTTITGKTIIEGFSHIGPNTEMHNAHIKNNVHVRHSLVFDSIVENNSTIGPFAHLRNGTHIGEENRIGNFVEVKNSTTGKDTKASHLAYIGDATVGKHVNFGAGSITVNYDGINKHQTIIGDDVFIGCNTNLVAPIKVENEVFIAAGSTVTKDIPSGSLTIARGKQINKEDYYKNFIKPKKDDK